MSTSIMFLSVCSCVSLAAAEESTQEDEDTGDPFSGFDDHGPGPADVGAQRTPELIRSDWSRRSTVPMPRSRRMRSG